MLTFELHVDTLILTFHVTGIRHIESCSQNTVDPSMNLLHMKEQFIPGSIQYVIRKILPTQNWQNDDTGMLVYHYSAKKAEENFS